MLRSSIPQSAATALFAAAILMTGSLAAQGPPAWISFVDETATRLFTPAATTDPDEKDFVVVDIDNDGDEDIVNARKEGFYASGSRPHMLLINQNGTLNDLTATYAPSFLSNPSLARVVVAADFDGDGWKDIVIANTDSQQSQYYKNLGSVGGVWQGLVIDGGRIPVFNPGPRFCSAAAGDIDHDGDPDLYLGDYNNNLEDRLCINDGTGHFTDQTATRFAGGIQQSGFSVDAYFVDLNNDGWLDLVDTDSGSTRLYVNTQAGTFATAQTLQTAANYTSAGGDLNNDGKVDIYLGQDGQDAYALNSTPNGSMTLSFTTVSLQSQFPGQPGYSSGTNAFAGNAYVVDMDNDGNADVVMADTDVDVAGCDRHATLLRSRPTDPIILTDPYADNWQNVHTVGTHDIAILDLNNDGMKDMVYGNCVGYKVFIQQLWTPPFTLSITSPQPGAANISVVGGLPNAPLYNLVGLVQISPAGAGPFFGLDVSAFNVFLSTQNLPPFMTVTSGTGTYTFSAPAGTVASGVHIQGRAIQVSYPSGVFTLKMSNIANGNF